MLPQKPAQDADFERIDTELLGIPPSAPKQEEELDAISAPTELAKDDKPQALPEDATQDEQPTDKTTEEGEDAQAEPEKVDYDMEIEVPMPYGMEPKTIGQLKDEVAAMHLTQQKVEKTRNELMMERRDLEMIIDALPQLPEEIGTIIQQRKQRLLAREGEAMLSAIPEWSEATTFQADRKEMLALTKGYGFSEAELEGVADHRLVKMIRDYTKLRNRVEKAGQTTKPVPRAGNKPSGHKPPKQNPDKLIESAKSSHDPRVKQAAISQLLKGT